MGGTTADPGSALREKKDVLRACAREVTSQKKALKAAQSAYRVQRRRLLVAERRQKLCQRALRAAQKELHTRREKDRSTRGAKLRVASARSRLTGAQRCRTDLAGELRAARTERGSCERRLRGAVARRDRARDAAKVEKIRLRQKQAGQAAAIVQARRLRDLRTKQALLRKALAEKHKAETQQLEERLGEELRRFRSRAASKLREGSERRRKRIADYSRSLRNGEPLHANKFRRTGASSASCSLKSSGDAPNLSGRISTLRPLGRHEYTLVYLHQFCLNGTNYMDWKPHYFFSATKLPYLNLKVTLPTAKAIPITAHEGIEQYAWYDYKTDFEGRREDQLDRRSLQETRDRIFAILDKEITRLGGDASKVFLGGASQGCCTALHCALQYPRRLGGFVGVVGHLLSSTPLPASKSSMPIYLYNGLADQTMRWSWVRKTYQRFKDAQYTNVHIHKEEGITHEKLAGNERKWILNFLAQTIAKDSKSSVTGFGRKNKHHHRRRLQHP